MNRVFLFGLVLVHFFLVDIIFAETIIPDPPKVNASSYLLIDYHSGTVITGHNIDQKIPPASLTKIMTSYVAAHALARGDIQLDQAVIISEKAWRMPGSRMFVEVDKAVLVEDLLKGVIVQSGNDASVAIAEFISGSEQAFASLMNQHARHLGMENTHFTNSTGLPAPDHYTTTKDLAILSKALIHEFPEIYAWYKLEEFSFNGIRQKNRNQLLWRDPYVDGIKTGHTEEAKFCLVASAIRDNMRLISVVTGVESETGRIGASQSLLNYGFGFYQTYKLYDAYVPIKRIRVWQGQIEEIDLGLDQALYITVPRGQYDRIKVAVDVRQRLIAPIKKDATMGRLHITLDEQAILSRPVVALASVERGNILRRWKDRVRMFFE